MAGVPLTTRFTAGRGGEIRTHGESPHVGFQDRCIKPLCHPSDEAANVIWLRAKESVKCDETQEKTAMNFDFFFYAFL